MPRSNRKRPKSKRPPHPLTDRQAEVFGYILKFTADHFYQPSVREIGDALGMSSPNAVARHLKALEQKGYIERTGKARAIRILKT